MENRTDHRPTARKHAMPRHTTLRRTRPSARGEKIYGGLYHQGVGALPLCPEVFAQAPMNGEMPHSAARGAQPGAPLDTLTILQSGAYEVFFSLRGMPVDPAVLTLSLHKNGNPLPGAAVSKAARPLETACLQGWAGIEARAGDSLGLRVQSSTETRLLLPGGLNAYFLLG